MIAEPEIPEPPEHSAESAAAPSPGPPDSAQSKPSARRPYRAKGKIAELPKAQRERINAMLLDGSTYAAVIRKMAEDGRVAVRHVRRDAMDQLKKHGHDSGTTEDDLKHAEKELQKLTDDYIGKIDSHLAGKEKEIMTV